MKYILAAPVGKVPMVVDRNSRSWAALELLSAMVDLLVVGMEQMASDNRIPWVAAVEGKVLMEVDRNIHP